MSLNRWKVCRKDWRLAGKRPQICLCRKISNLYKVSFVFNVCLSFTEQVNYKVRSITKNYAFLVIVEQSDWSLENFSCNNKTNCTRRHKFITHKNNCCQIFSRSRNDQPLFVNEYKFKVGWQPSSPNNKFSGFRRAKHKHLFDESKPYSPTYYEHVSILTYKVDFKTLLPLFLLSFHWSSVNG